MGAEFDLILDQAWLEQSGEGVAFVGGRLSGEGLEKFVVGVDFEEHRISGRIEGAVVVESAVILVISGEELTIFGLLVFGRKAANPRVGFGFGDLESCGDFLG